jgi:hypothetical protein
MPVVRATVRTALWGTLVLAWLATATLPVGAHGSSGTLPDHGLGFGVVVGLTVGLGVLGGAVVLRRHRSRTGHPSVLWLGLLLVVLGCWAAVVAVIRGPALAAVVATFGAVAAWSLRDFAVVGHRGCDQAALGAVVLHRFVEGTLLAALYAADAAVGVGAALVLAVHAAAETGAIAGLWSAGRWRWVVVAVVQTGFVAGAFGGGVVARYVTPSASVAVLGFLGGALIATGVATTSTRQHGIHA